jgi:predicted O-linked N-acetylglucosamine transferase (SPINDLY family)
MEVYVDSRPVGLYVLVADADDVERHLDAAAQYLGVDRDRLTVFPPSGTTPPGRAP